MPPHRRRQNTPQAHSALTTILLDDSPLKAVLQPYNHICIGEYSAERRAQDLASLEQEREWELFVAARAQVKADESAVQENVVVPGTFLSSRADDVRQEERSEDVAQEKTSREKRKRKNKEVYQDAIAQEGPMQENAYSSSSSPSDSTSSLLSNQDKGGDRVELNSRKRQRKSKRQKKLETLAHDAGVTEPERQYDETLLAVVGVLDAVKQQRNVAAWIRSGGLWHPTVEPVPAITNVRDAVSGPSEGVLEDAGDGVGGIAFDDREDGAKRRRRKRRHRDAAASDKHADASTVVANPGNDAVTTVETSVPELNPPSHVKDASVTTIPSDSMWFEDVKTVAYWAERGRRALEGLGIPVEHGIDR